MEKTERHIFETNLDKWIEEGLEGQWVLIKKSEPFIFPKFEDALNCWGKNESVFIQRILSRDRDVFISGLWK